MNVSSDVKYTYIIICDKNVTINEGSLATIADASAPTTVDSNPRDLVQYAAAQVNNPQLLTTITLAKMRLSFLIRCRILKRIPKSLRIR